MVLVQKWPFFELFMLGNIGQENIFLDILSRKNAFLGYRKKKFKKSKYWRFSKGVNPWFLFKNGQFSNFFFRPGSYLLRYFSTKKRLSRLSKQEVQKSKNWHYSKGVNPWFWSRNGDFSNLFFFLGNIGQENIFYDILPRKNAFLGYKIKNFQNRKIDIFANGLTYGFGPKVQKVEKLTWFWSKNGDFSNFIFLRQCRPGKYLLRYSSTKKHFSRLEKQQVQKVEKLIFFHWG